jgi:hypothetical protein
MVIASIPIKIGYSKKIKTSVNMINEDLKNPQTGFNIESTYIISNSDGIGISVSF